MNMKPQETYILLLEALGKWRNVLAARMFGYWKNSAEYKSDSRKKAQYDEYAELRELTLALRAEMNSIAQLMLNKKIFTEEEYILMMNDQMGLLLMQYQKHFPGIVARWDMVGVTDKKAWDEAKKKYGIPPMPQELN